MIEKEIAAKKTFNRRRIGNANTAQVMNIYTNIMYMK